MILTRTQTIPTISLKKAVLFPSATMPIILEGADAINTLNEALTKNHQIVLNFSANGNFASIGVLSVIKQSWYLAPHIMGASLEGLRRVKIHNVFSHRSVNQAEVSEVSGNLSDENDLEIKALSRFVLHQFNRLVETENSSAGDLYSNLNENLSPDRLSDSIAAVLPLDYQEKIKVLEKVNIKERLDFLSGILSKETSIANAEAVIQKKVNEQVGKVEKEFVLREQLKAIEKELGIYEEQEQYSDLESKLKSAQMPQEVEAKALKELSRLKRMQSQSPEAPYIWTYLEIIADLPWNKKTEETIGLIRAREILDEDHYGLEKVKERILEHLAVQKLTKKEGRGTILCFIGPPGVGKTSIGQSIARALGRKFTRISLGGITDESELRGHRRTYVGAMPGKIISSIRQSGSKNPVFMIDEIDKIGQSYRGDPSSALLEVLDPAQNNSFVDHYLDMPFDLSEVFFITTANVLDTIPLPLRDRMEIIEFSGYTTEEKLNIAKRFLVPKSFEKNGINPELVVLKDGAILQIITRYTLEAGVRNLERKIDQISRVIAKGIIERKIPQNKKLVINEGGVTRYLGPEEVDMPIKSTEDEVGVATGLAWTPVGGQTIFIETRMVVGNKSLSLTGQLGEVMQESAKAAVTYVRSLSPFLKVDPKIFNNLDIHVHVPSGSVAKDGPSAGVAIVVALASSVVNKKIKKDLAFTGEVTLTGKVLKVSGIKEKVIAAYRSGVKEIIMPKDNEKNLYDVPPEAKKNLRFRFIRYADEAIKLALKI